MQVSPLEPRVKAEAVPLDRLADNPALSQQDKVAEVCRQFEAILLRQILTEAQKPVVQSSLIENSATAGIYRDLVTQHLADSISQSGTLGLSRSLASQLSRQLPAHSAPTGADAASAAAAKTLSPTRTAGATPGRRSLPSTACHHD